MGKKKKYGWKKKILNIWKKVKFYIDIDEWKDKDVFFRKQFLIIIEELQGFLVDMGILLIFGR